ncbi:transcriptional regulator [bacterium]|nr:transcriptional regulator [bacterium]
MSEPARHRSYDEGCLAAHALDLIGDRWSLLVVRELMLGPLRFGALRAGLPGISANILTLRLAELQALGLLRPVILPPPAQVAAYGLTEAGRALWPVIRGLCHWGARQPGHDPGRFISPVSLMLSMTAMFEGPCPDLVAGFDLAGQCFRMQIRAGAPFVARSPDATGDFTLTGSTNAVAALIYGAGALTDHLAGGLVRCAGDLRRAEAFRAGLSLDRAAEALPFP